MTGVYVTIGSGYSLLLYTWQAVTWINGDLVEPWGANLNGIF